LKFNDYIVLLLLLLAFVLLLLLVTLSIVGSISWLLRFAFVSRFSISNHNESEVLREGVNIVLRLLTAGTNNKS